MSYAQNRGRALAEAFDAGNIAKCRENPELAAEEAAGDLCIPCMMPHPCLCDRYATWRKMREYYEANRRIEPTKDGLFTRGRIGREEPVLEMSWGQKGDGLMDGLYRIAREPYVKEIARLRDKIERLEKRNVRK